MRILTLLLILTSCNKECYNINNHYTWHPITLSNQVFGTLTINCVSTHNQINKGIGITAQFFNPQVNKVQIGWMGQSDSVRLYAYYYINSVRDSAYLYSAAYGHEIECQVSISRDSYFMRVDGHVWVKYLDSPIAKNKFKPVLLYPYYGGEESAPEECEVCLTVN